MKARSESFVLLEIVSIALLHSRLLIKEENSHNGAILQDVQVNYQLIQVYLFCQNMLTFFGSIIPFLQYPHPFSYGPEKCQQKYLRQFVL